MMKLANKCLFSHRESFVAASIDVALQLDNSELFGVQTNETTPKKEAMHTHLHHSTYTRHQAPNQLT